MKYSNELIKSAERLFPESQEFICALMNGETIVPNEFLSIQASNGFITPEMQEIIGNLTKEIQDAEAQNPDLVETKKRTLSPAYSWETAIAKCQAERTK